MKHVMERLKLTVNAKKTRLCRIPTESVEFLGYTIGRCWSPQKGHAYIGTRPSKSRIQRICREISEMTSRRWLLVDTEDQVTRLNRLLVGWANYFRLGPVSKAYRNVDSHVRHRLRRWLCKKHKVQGRGTTRYSDQHLYQKLGLVQLELRTRSFPWAKA